MSKKSWAAARAALFIVCALATAACGPGPSPESGDADTGVPTSDTGDACVADCTGRSCGANGCGGSCGTCKATERCEEEVGLCICFPEPDAELCQAAGAECGALVATDRCGEKKELACGSCEPLVQRCVANQCECVPEEHAALCKKAERLCGPASLMNRCGGVEEIAECGGCPAGERCDASGKCVYCVGEEENELCAAAGRECGSLTIVDGCQRARQIESCGQCANTDACTKDGLCAGDRRPENDTCDTDEVLRGAKELLFDEEGIAHAYGDLRLATDDATFDCSAVATRDAVFKLRLAVPAEVRFELIAPSWTRSGLELRSDCKDTLPGAGGGLSVMDCATAQEGATAVLGPRFLEAGVDYFVWVEAGFTYAQEGSEGPFELIATQVTPEPPANDACDALEPQMLPLGRTLLHGSTLRASDDFVGSCVASYGGADVVFAFELESPASLIAHLTSPSSRFKPLLYLSSACTNRAADEVACARYLAGSAELRIPRLAEGVWYLFVDGNRGEAGPFDLALTVGDEAARPADDSCSESSLPPITFDEDGRFSVQGEMTWARDDYYGACTGDTAGPDRVFPFVLGENAYFEAALVNRAPSSSGYLPQFYLKESCDQFDNLFCLSSTTTKREIGFSSLDPALLEALGESALLAGRTYYLVVDGLNPQDGAFELSLFTRGAISNDACTEAERLPPFGASNTVTARGNTLGSAEATTEHSCTRSAALPPKHGVVYRLALSADSNLKVRVVPTAGSSLRPYISLRSQCGELASELVGACARAAEHKGTASMEIANLSAANSPYFLWVSGDAPGPFEVEVDRTELTTLANDLCDENGAIALQFDGNGIARATGNLAYGQNDYVGGCSEPNHGWKQVGRDLVYRLSIEEPSSLRVVVANAGSSGYLPAFSLRSACAESTPAAGEERICATTSMSNIGAAEAEIHAFGEGDYYLIVDGTGADAESAISGAFSLEVTRRPIASGELCGHEHPLGIIATNASVQGDTRQALNDWTGGDACAGALSNDLVYTFSLAEERSVTLSISTSDALFRPSLSLHTSCATPNSIPLACAISGVEGGAQLHFARLSAGITYYVWVDSPGTPASAGPFELTVTTSEPPTLPLNAFCADAEPLQFQQVGGSDLRLIAIASGDTTPSLMNSNGTGECADAFAPELVYHLYVPQRALVSIKLQTVDSPDYEPRFYLRTLEECALGASAATQLLCGGLKHPPVPALSRQMILEYGNYALIVDGARGTHGKFELTVNMRKDLLGNDDCTGAADPYYAISFATGNEQSVSGFLEGAQNDASSDSSNCSSLGRDVVYAFTTTAPQKVTITHSTTAGLYTPVLRLRRQCEVEILSDVGCSNATFQGSPTTLTINSLQPGTYYLWVDGVAFNTLPSAETQLPFTATVKLEAGPVPPSNDLCLNATELSFVGNTASIVASPALQTASNDYRGGCDTGGQTNRGDVAYSYTSTGGKHSLGISLNSPDVLHQGLFYVRRDCSDAGATSELLCKRMTGTQTSTSGTVQVADGETVWIIVDTLVGNPTTFSLNVTRTTVP